MNKSKCKDICPCFYTMNTMKWFIRCGPIYVKCMTFCGSKFLAAKMCKPGKTALYVQYGIHKQTQNMHYMKIFSGNKKKKTVTNQISDLKIPFAKDSKKCKRCFCFVDIYLNTPQGDILIWSMFYSYRPKQRRVILEESICRQSQRVSNILRQQ